MSRFCWGLGAILRTEAHRWVISLLAGDNESILSTSCGFTDEFPCVTSCCSLA